MAKLYGTDYTREDLIKRTGDISQIAGVRLITLDDGFERGVRAAEFRSGSGLEFTVLIDRGLDISSAYYNGQPLAWRSSTSDKHPSYLEEEDLGWLRSFHGGLVLTCGLTYAGAPCTDQGKQLGLHGRISHIPATNVCADSKWDYNDYTMWVQGKMRESMVFGENVELARKITARLGESKLWIHDRVTNMGFQETEHMMIYHCNIGFPIVDGGSRLIAPVKESRSRDADAEVEKEKYTEFQSPVPGFKERVYYLDMTPDANGDVWAALVNKSFNGGQGFGIYMRYPKKSLPRFGEWKMTGEGVYVVGMEPANCGVEGRDKERERNTLEFLKPGETKEYHLEIGVLTSQSDITEFEEKVSNP